MGLKFEDGSAFSQMVFDKYTTKLEHKEEQGHRNIAKISDKLQFNKEDVAKTVYGKSTLIFNEQNLGQAVAGMDKASVLHMSDNAYEVEKSRIISDMVNKNPKTRIDSSTVQKEVRKQIAKKYGVKTVKTESDLKAGKVELRKKARTQTRNMQGRMRMRSAVRRGATNVIMEQGAAAREKDLGTEALIKANRFTKKYRRDLFSLLYTPDTAIRSYNLSKLEKKQTLLERKKDKEVMKEFFNNVHQNEAAVMESLYGTSGMHKEALHTRFRTRDGYGGHVKTVKEIKKFTKENRDTIMREMQKKSNRKKYRKAIYGNGSSALVLADRRLLFSQTSLLARLKSGGKNIVAKLSTGCLIAFMVGCGLLACVFLILGLLFANILSSTNETTSWTNITAITTDFTKKETDFVPDILASDEPITTDVTIDDYEWYVIEDGSETEVDSKVAILDRWNELGQADQNKLMAFICTLQTDATLDKVEYIIDDIIDRMYDLSIEVEERTVETDGCGCGCQSSPAGECSCSDCPGSGGEETQYVQVTKFTINDLDKVIDELYDEYCTPEKKEQLISYYHTYQITRGGNASLGNVVWYRWYSGATPPSSYYGWRFIDRGDGNGYKVEEHKGLDIPSRTGTSLYMPYDGTIHETGYDDSRGNYVVLLNEEGTMRVTYMHMNNVFVLQGDEKKRAYTIGSIGSTGDSTGPHLHVNVEVKDDSGHWVYVNPLFVFSEEKVYKNSYGEMADEDE